MKEVHHLLEGAPGVHFIGNVEGRDVVTDVVDVVVTDGFTGNVVLKTLEGGLEVILGVLRSGLASTSETRAAAEVLAPVLEPLFESMEPETYWRRDAARRRRRLHHQPRPVVGPGGQNAIALAAEMVDGDIVGGLRTAIAAPT